MRNNCRVVLTDRCNLDCDFCCMKDKEMYDSFELLEAVWIAAMEYDEIAITGGEPLIELEKLVQFVCLIKYFNKDAKIYLYTNGILLRNETAAMLKVAGLTGINWSPKEKPSAYDMMRMSFIHACVTPIRILVQDILVDDNILNYALHNGMQIKQWTLGDCDDMEPEDRYRIDWNRI